LAVSLLDPVDEAPVCDLLLLQAAPRSTVAASAAPHSTALFLFN